MDVLGIIIAALFAQNFVLVKFMGICPFLGVSKKPSAALGMGLAVTAVMIITCLVTYPIYVFVLLPLKLEYLEIIVFILIIAALVQMLEMILKKFSPGLYSALGIYLPLVTTNCAILGVAELVIEMTTVEEAHFVHRVFNTVAGGFTDYGMAMSLGEAVFSGLMYGLGFTLAIVLLAGLRQKVDKLNVAKPLRGFPMTMLTACFMAMAFYIFTLI